ncbi:MAG: Gfo/Idh/MocA family oxidoreductase [Actinobacteria bacterium]|nr:Gfo/Idh/MocA family oxidoreductase [Actinomycetota bacterium]
MGTTGSTPLRVGLVGYGLAGSAFHAPIIAALPQFELAVIVARGEDKIAAARARYPEALVIQSVDQLVGMGLDLAVIATPNQTHYELARQVIRAGINVVVDKPLATSSEQAAALVSQAEGAGVLICCYQNRRWDGDFLTVEQLIGQGRLGKVARFESRFERFRPSIKPGWKERPGPGSGILWDLGPHVIDQAIHLFGEPEEVYSEIRTVRPGAQVDDNDFIALIHPNGVTSHLSVSAIAGAPGPRFRVLGTRGAYLKDGLDPQEAALRAGGDPAAQSWGTEDEGLYGLLCKGDEQQVVPTLPGDYKQFYIRMAAAILGEGPVPVDPRTTISVLRIIENALRG